MNLGFLTTDDPIYLPSFFAEVLPPLSSRHRVRVYSSPPLYKNQSSFQAAARYFKTFGARDTLRLCWKVGVCKLNRRSVTSACIRAGVPYTRVGDVNDTRFLDRLRREQTELLISVSSPQLFRSPLIALPPLGVWNIHGALLPHYRGVMPGFWMLAQGETRAGVSIYFVNEAIDAGELCGQTAFEIDPRESLDAFVRRSKQIAAKLLLETLQRLERGELTRHPMDLSQGSYHSWPTREAVGRFRSTGRRVW